MTTPETTMINGRGRCMTFIPDDELEERLPRRRPRVQRKREGNDKPAASAGASAADATPARNDPKVEVAVQKSNPDAMPATAADKPVIKTAPPAEPMTVAPVPGPNQKSAWPGGSALTLVATGVVLALGGLLLLRRRASRLPDLEAENPFQEPLVPMPPVPPQDGDAGIVERVPSPTRSPAQRRRLVYGAVAVACLVALGAMGLHRGISRSGHRLRVASTEEHVLSLPADRTSVRAKVSRRGDNIALWVRRVGAIQLLVPGRQALTFQGHVGFQGGGYFHTVTPAEGGDVLGAGTPESKTGRWLAWGPGEDGAGNSLDEYLVFDPSGEHVAYAVYDHGRWSWVLDDKSLGNFQQLGPLLLSEGAKEVAWVDGWPGGAMWVHSHGRNGPDYRRVFANGMFLSPSGDHLFFIASRSDRAWFAVWDGTEEAEYPGIGSVATFSKDGHHYAYSVERRPDRGLSPDGGSQASQSGSESFVVDGKVQAHRFDGMSSRFTFSPDGKRFAYCGQRGDQWFVVVDGIEGKACAGVFGLAFSPNGEHFVKGETGSDGRLHVFVDGVERSSHVGEPVASPLVNADGTHWAFVLRRNKADILVFDGKEGPELQAARDLTFSKDGRHLAYLAQIEAVKGKLAVYVDDQIQGEFEGVPDGLFFTPGGQLVYPVREQGKWTMAIDGQRGKAYDYLFRPPHELSALLHADGKLVYYALLGDEIVRVTHE